MVPSARCSGCSSSAWPLAFDLRGLWTLVSGSDVAVLAVVVLTLSVSATFAGAAIGTAVMLLPEREEDDKAYGGVDADGNPRRPRRMNG